MMIVSSWANANDTKYVEIVTISVSYDDSYRLQRVIDVLCSIKSIPSLAMETNNSRFEYKHYQYLH